MATLTATCDDCGIILRAGEIYTDYDSHDRCQICDLKYDLYEAEQSLERQKKRFEETYLKEIEIKEAEVTRIKKELEILNA